MDVTGNTPTSIDTIDGCREVTMGLDFDVDVVVDEIDPVDGVSHASFDLEYDPLVLRVLTRSGPEDILFGQAGNYVDLISESLPDSDGNYLHSASDTTGPHESGPGVIARFKLWAVSPGDSTLVITDNLEMDGEPNILDANSNGLNVNHIFNAEIRVDTAPCPELDFDGDGWPNSSDNCPHWPNPSQALPPWNLPAGDSDCDGFPDTTGAPGRGPESFIATDATDHCADTTTPNDERGPTFGEPVSPWPPDVNDTQFATLSDVISFGPHFNKLDPDPAYSPRFDLNASGGVTLSDIIGMGPFFNKGCL